MPRIATSLPSQCKPKTCFTRALKSKGPGQPLHETCGSTRVKRRNQPKWFNVNILKEIRTRDNSLKKARKSNLEKDCNLYKRANTVGPV